MKSLVNKHTGHTSYTQPSEILNQGRGDSLEVSRYKIQGDRTEGLQQPGWEKTPFIYTKVNRNLTFPSIMNAANTFTRIDNICDFLILPGWRYFENIYTHPFSVIVVVKENGFFTHHTLTPNMWVFSAHQFCDSLDTNWVPTIAFNSETIYLELLSDSTALRPWSHSPSFSSDSVTVMGPCGSTLLFNLAAKLRVPHTPPQIG